MDAAGVGLFGHMLPVVIEFEAANLAVLAVALPHLKRQFLHRLAGAREAGPLRLYLLNELAAFGRVVGLVVGLREAESTFSAGRRKVGVKKCESWLKAGRMEGGVVRGLSEAGGTLGES